MKLYDIEGYEGLYAITELGKVWSYRKNYFIKEYTHRQGYKFVTLTLSKGERKTVYVHRLVANQFVPNPLGKPQVNHINGLKDDNRIENLEWCTMSENNQHAYDNNLMCRKGENSNNKLTSEQVLEIRSKHVPRKYTYMMLAEEYGVVPCTIYEIVSRRTWTHI